MVICELPISATRLQDLWGQQLCAPISCHIGLNGLYIVGDECTCWVIESPGEGRGPRSKCWVWVAPSRDSGIQCLTLGHLGSCSARVCWLGGHTAHIATGTQGSCKGSRSPGERARPTDGAPVTVRRLVLRTGWSPSNSRTCPWGPRRVKEKMKERNRKECLLEHLKRLGRSKYSRFGDQVGNRFSPGQL